MEFKHIDNVEEIVNRLVANNFECEYDKNSNIVKFMSCSRYEENKYDLIGYDYVEEHQCYEVSLDEIDLSFEELASMVVVETKKKVAINIQKMLKRNITFIESNIRYLS